MIRLVIKKPAQDLAHASLLAVDIHDALAVGDAALPQHADDELPHGLNALERRLRAGELRRRPQFLYVPSFGRRDVLRLFLYCGEVCAD